MDAQSNVSTLGEIRRLVSSAGLYAAAALAQRGVGFLLIPIYTRLIDPHDYGVLEILNAFSGIALTLLTLGLGSAINKCYHRDCKTPDEQAGVLVTALGLQLPVVALGTAAVLIFSTPISAQLVGRPGAERLLVLVSLSLAGYSMASLGLSALRAQERAGTFSILTLLQFLTAIGFNIVFVVVYRMGVLGILLGNLLSMALFLPTALATALRGARLRFDHRLSGPLLRFGLLLIPAMLAGWVMDMSDRYVLRLYRGLDEVAIYGIGYKFGMMVDMAIVWPFQLAWPAFAFAISNRPGHQATYARTLTYFTLVSVFFVLALSLGARAVLSVAVGEAYRDAHHVVPPVALAYALYGIHYCVSPGIHVGGKTRYLTGISVVAAGFNLVLNLALVPRFGMMGAAWATVAAFGLMAACTIAVAQRAHPVAYEYVRLAKIVGAGVAVYLVAANVPAATSAAAGAAQATLLVLAFPVLLLFARFPNDEERAVLRGMRMRQRQALSA